MANIYLDTNKVVDLLVRNPELSGTLSGHHICLSPLSAHILFYTEKFPVPTPSINKSLMTMKFVSFDDRILQKAINGPTKDLEDNIQLHSAVEADCDIFLTSDKRLLKMDYFGKVKISSSI
jgi:predicted nucleic acid-binding protein